MEHILFFEQVKEGILIRVRLTPNSSSCSIKGIFTDADDNDFLKISVVNVPEKGKANKELVCFLAKKLKISQSCFKIISGETDRYKKILISVSDENLIQALKKLV